MVAPVLAAAQSELLNWRNPIYIASGFAGIIGLSLLLIQPLLVARILPDLAPTRAQMVHRWIGGLLVVSIMLHVLGLYLTSPPDVIDALLFASPTPFSDWGVLGMWALIATAFLGAFRGWLNLPLRYWRLAHTALAVFIVACSILHVVLIEGTMETVTKVVIVVLVGAALACSIFARRLWRSWVARV